LQRYTWPGNVRELVNVVERAVVLAKSDTISARDLPDALKRENNGHARSLAGMLLTGNLKSALSHPERQIIIEALETNGWNRQDTARTLGINRTTLYKKMRKYDISYEQHVMVES
jgi:DNA-binding NtrC family response regulator